MTHPGAVEALTKSFNPNGKARWLALTCVTNYELVGSGPFIHRRILFKSSLPGWQADQLNIRANVDASGCTGAYTFGRRPAHGLSKQSIVECLHRLFRDKTVRGCVQGPVNGAGITVLKDENFQATGAEDGKRLYKKWYNPFKGEPTMHYTMDSDGSFGFALTNSPSSQHIYIVDVFSFGLGGLDSSLPAPRTQKQEVLSGTSMGVSLDKKPAKRARSDESVLSADSKGNFNMEGVQASLDGTGDGGFMKGDDDDGQVKIITEAKLYFKAVR